MKATTKQSKNTTVKLIQDLDEIFTDCQKRVSELELQQYEMIQRMAKLEQRLNKLEPWL